MSGEMLNMKGTLRVCESGGGYAEPLHHADTRSRTISTSFVSFRLVRIGLMNLCLYCQSLISMGRVALCPAYVYMEPLNLRATSSS